MSVSLPTVENTWKQNYSSERERELLVAAVTSSNYAG